MPALTRSQASPLPLLPAGSYEPVVFDDEVIYVVKWIGKGLSVVDPARQAGVESGRTRTWIGYRNVEVDLFAHRISPDPPESLEEVRLAIRGYAAFLNPSYERPRELDGRPRGFIPEPEPVYSATDLPDDADPWS